MCERLLNLQEIYVSGQNICIEVYGNSVGTITPQNVITAPWNFAIKLVGKTRLDARQSLVSYRFPQFV